MIEYTCTAPKIHRVWVDLDIDIFFCPCKEYGCKTDSDHSSYILFLNPVHTYDLIKSADIIQAQHCPTDIGFRSRSIFPVHRRLQQLHPICGSRIFKKNWFGPSFLQYKVTPPLCLFFFSNSKLFVSKTGSSTRRIGSDIFSSLSILISF